MVNVKEDFRIAIENMLRRKIRSFLTILAIVIGLGSVVALIGLGNGLQNTLDVQFEIMGSNKLMISPGGGFYGIGGGAVLNDDDIEVIRKVGGIERADAWSFKLGRQEYNDKLIYSFVMGLKTEDDNFEAGVTAFGIQMLEGRALKSNEKYKAVVGCMTANDAENNFFGKELGVGKKFDIEGQNFQVVGVVSCVGNPGDDQNIYINIDTLRELFGETEIKYDMIFAAADEGRNLDPIVEEIKKDLRNSRDLKEGDEDFSIQTTAQLMETFTGVFNIVLIVVGGIGAISLLVGAVGIANTMFTSILERTKEIGAMKAIGAQNSDILLIIVFESGLLGLFGGGIGIAVGWLIARGVGILVTNLLSFELLVRFSPGFLIGLLTFSFLLGIISGVIPAYRASKMNVIDALRYE